MRRIHRYHEKNLFDDKKISDFRLLIVTAAVFKKTDPIRTLKLGAG